MEMPAIITVSPIDAEDLHPMVQETAKALQMEADVWWMACSPTGTYISFIPNNTKEAVEAAIHKNLLDLDNERPYFIVWQDRSTHNDDEIRYN